MTYLLAEMSKKPFAWSKLFNIATRKVKSAQQNGNPGKRPWFLITIAKNFKTFGQMNFLKHLLEELKIELSYYTNTTS